MTLFFPGCFENKTFFTNLKFVVGKMEGWNCRYKVRFGDAF